MHRLQPVISEENIPQEYLSTPIGLLLKYHNLKLPFDTYQQAQLLIGMCMDNRKHLNIPDNFAFIIRSGGGNLRYSEFKVSFAIGVGGISTIALLGHTNCGMVDLASKKEMFVKGLQERAGWTKEQSEEHFIKYAPVFEIGNEVDFLLSEQARLRKVYPKILIVPMLYKVEDNLLYLIDQKS